MFNFHVFEPRVFAAFQPQVDEPEDPQPGAQLLVSNVQAVTAQHRRRVVVRVSVSDPPDADVAANAAVSICLAPPGTQGPDCERLSAKT
jgi:hypothetical protein